MGATLRLTDEQKLIILQGSDYLAPLVATAQSAAAAAQAAAGTAANDAAASVSATLTASVAASATTATTKAGEAASSASTATTKAGEAASSAAAAANAAIPFYANRMKSAVGGGTLGALFDMDGPRTAFSGSSTILTSLSSLDDTPLSLSVFTSIFSGADPRPYWTSRGIYMGAQAGLETSSPLMTTADGFAFLYAVDLDTVTSTVSLFASLPASPADGDMVLVNGDRNVDATLGSDVALVLDAGFTNADLVNGYYKRNSSAPSWEKSTLLFRATGPSGARFEASLTHLGQLQFFIYDGTRSSTLTSKGNVVMGRRKLVIGVRRKADVLTLYLNGQALFGIGNTPPPTITDLNKWYFNGSGRTANTVQPIVNGLRHYLRGVAAANNLSASEFQAFHDTFAARHSAPLLARPRHARGIAAMGQSWLDGGIGVNDTWTGTGGWNGTVAPKNVTYHQETEAVTRQAFPNFYSARNADTPWDIAPLAITQDRSGNVSVATSHMLGTTGENLMLGMAAQLNSRAEGLESDWILSGSSAGGATIALLSAQSVVPLVQNLKTTTLTATDYYNKLLRQIVYAKDFARSKGQAYSVDLFLWQQGHSDNGSTTYLASLTALYDRFCADVSAITGQAHKPILIAPQINYSSNGTANTANSGTGNIDQLFLDMEDNRGTRPMFSVGPMYQVTNFIHPYRLGHRWVGEIVGAAAAQILFDGERYLSLRPIAYAYTIGGTTIDISYPIRTGRALSLGQTNANNVSAALANHGFEFTDASAGGVTISSVAVTNTGASGTGVIRITLSGAIGAGDKIFYTGAGSRYGNVTDGAKINGIYSDQDWTVPFTAGAPTYALGLLNDIRRWAAASVKTL